MGPGGGPDMNDSTSNHLSEPLSESLLISPITYQWKRVYSDENVTYFFPGSITSYMKLKYGFPALYRWVIRKFDDSVVYYLGETDGLVPRRIYQYLNPGPSQKTNQRLHVEFNSEIQKNSKIHLEYLTFSPFSINNQLMCQSSLTDPHVRRLIEELFTVFSQGKGESLLNR